MTLFEIYGPEREGYRTMWRRWGFDEERSGDNLMGNGMLGGTTNGR